MWLRSYCGFDQIPLEIWVMILSHVQKDGAGTLRQVCRAWKTVIDERGWGRRTHAMWVTGSISAVNWAHKNDFPSFCMHSWARWFMQHSPFEVLE